MPAKQPTFTRTHSEWLRSIAFRGGVIGLYGDEELESILMPKDGRSADDVVQEMNARGVSATLQKLHRAIGRGDFPRPKDDGRNLIWTNADVDAAVAAMEARGEYTQEGHFAAHIGVKLGDIDRAMMLAEIDPTTKRFRLEFGGMYHPLLNIYRTVKVIPFTAEENAEVDRMLKEAQERLEQQLKAEKESK